MGSDEGDVRLPAMQVSPQQRADADVRDARVSHAPAPERAPPDQATWPRCEYRPRSPVSRWSSCGVPVASAWREIGAEGWSWRDPTSPPASRQRLPRPRVRENARDGRLPALDGGCEPDHMTFAVAARSYDRFMGRYSIPFAPILISFAGI